MENVKEKLQECLKSISEKAENKEYNEYSESQISQELIKPILRILGWNVENAKEVCSQFPTSKQSNIHVDYALLIKEKPSLLIEVKRMDLDEEAEKQLKKYMIDVLKEYVVGILTNGIYWRFYFLCKDEEEIDLVLQIAIEEERLDIAVEYFLDFLLKERVCSGAALKEMRKFKKENSNLGEKEKEKLLVNGWNSLFSNDFLQNRMVKLLEDEILLNKGFTLEEEMLKKFIEDKMKDVKPSIQEIPYKSKFKGNLTICSRKHSHTIAIQTSTQTLEYKSMKAAILDFVNDISMLREEVLEQFQENEMKLIGKKKKEKSYITKKIAKEDKDSYTEVNGWYVCANIGKQSKKTIWEPLCKMLDKKLTTKNIY